MPFNSPNEDSIIGLPEWFKGWMMANPQRAKDFKNGMKTMRFLDSRDSTSTLEWFSGNRVTSSSYAE